jgi:hypothetical protein
MSRPVHGDGGWIPAHLERVLGPALAVLGVAEVAISAELGRLDVASALAVGLLVAGST